MAALVYSAICSLDGYVADSEGHFEWSAPTREVHHAVNDVERATGTMLLGRRMYDVLVAWETIDPAGEPPEIGEFSAIWHGTDKIVYSTTLDEIRSARTRIVRDFEPSEIAELKEQLDAPLSIGGPTLAAEAFRAGLVDVVHLFVNPVIVGGGRAALPDGVRTELRLGSVESFANGVVHTAYTVTQRSG